MAGAKWAGHPEFHVVGDVLIDVLATGLERLPKWNEDAEADEIRCCVGGSALNTAVHLKAILGPERGGAVAFYGCVGEDTFARAARDRLEEAGVAPHLTPFAGLPTGSCVVLSGGAERAFVTCAGAAGKLGAEHLTGVAAAVRKARGPVHVHFGGFYSYGPLRWEVPELVRTLRAAAAERGVALTVSVDANGAEPCHLQGLAEALGCVDVFKGNQAEASALSGCAEVSKALEFLTQRCGSAVVTCGRDGAHFQANGECGHVDAVPVQPRDCTGAGDACSAGLVACLALGAPLEEAVRVGCGAGTVACTHAGGSDTAVTAEDVEELLAGRQPIPPCLVALTRREAVGAAVARKKGLGRPS